MGLPPVPSLLRARNCSFSHPSTAPRGCTICLCAPSQNKCFLPNMIAHNPVLDGNNWLFTAPDRSAAPTQCAGRNASQQHKKAMELRAVTTMKQSAFEERHENPRGQRVHVLMMRRCGAPLFIAHCGRWRSLRPEIHNVEGSGRSTCARWATEWRHKCLNSLNSRTGGGGGRKWPPSVGAYCGHVLLRPTRLGQSVARSSGRRSHRRVAPATTLCLQSGNHDDR